MFIFIYGSLKQGFGNHRVLQELGLEFVGNGITSEAVFDLVDLGAFPGLVKGEFHVAGEVYEVSEDIENAALRILDRFEGTPSFYRRATITVNRMKEPDWIKETETETYILVSGRHENKVDQL